MPKRVIVSYEKMSEDLQEIFKEKYPKGYADYMGDLITIDKPDGTSFTAISINADDTVFLVKMPVKVDDYEEAEKEIFNEEQSEEDDAGNDVFPEEGTENMSGDSDSDDE